MEAKSTKEIALVGKNGEGRVTIVDDEAYEELAKYRWHLSGWGYASTSINGRTTSMHRVIMRTPKGFHTDHINGDKLDNRKENLRVCTAKENLRNKRKSNRASSSSYKGVSWESQTRMWRTQIGFDGKASSVGRYLTEIEAAFAYDVAAALLYGEFARTNNVSSDVVSTKRKDQIERQVRSWVKRTTVSG